MCMEKRCPRRRPIMQVLSVENPKEAMHSIW
jgi:hypothetical protein